MQRVTLSNGGGEFLTQRRMAKTVVSERTFYPHAECTVSPLATQASGGEACRCQVVRSSRRDRVVAVLSPLIANFRVEFAPAENLRLGGMRRWCIRRSEIRFVILAAV